MSIFALPWLKSTAGALVGIFLVALGTGGIKPCVSAHGGDQFIAQQKSALNNFYNYFYLSINVVGWNIIKGGYCVQLGSSRCCQSRMLWFGGWQLLCMGLCHVCNVHVFGLGYLYPRQIHLPHCSVSKDLFAVDYSEMSTSCCLSLS